MKPETRADSESKPCSTPTSFACALRVLRMPASEMQCHAAAHTATNTRHCDMCRRVARLVHNFLTTIQGKWHGVCICAYTLLPALESHALGLLGYQLEP